ncbi:MAG: c-type cytochrome [Gammaproteobacteria bacterium]
MSKQSARSSLAGFLILLATSLQTLMAAPNGAALFEEHCAVCHGIDGTGALGVPLIKPKFATLTNEYLTKTIRNGRPGRVMPAFETMSDSQVDAIVAYLREWSGSEDFKEKAHQAEGDLEHGKNLYAKNCVQCHGENGHGVGQGTGVTFSRKRDFEVIPPAIGNIGFLNSASDAMLHRTISDGREGSVMISFKDAGLSDQDIDDLIVYLRSFADMEEEQIEAEPDSTFIVESNADFETTVKNVKAALVGSNFRVFPDRYLEQGLFFDNEVNKKQLTIRFCNFNQLYGLLKQEPRLGMMLPCRITVVEDEDGTVKLMAMNMVLISKMFNNEQLLASAYRMQQTILDLLEEATF